MNTDGLVQSVVRFSSESPVPVDPINVNPDIEGSQAWDSLFYGSQTGDSLPLVILAIFTAVIVVCGIFMYVYRKRVLTTIGSYTDKKTCTLFKTTTRFMVIAFVVLLVIVSYLVACFANVNIINANASTKLNVETPQVITANISDEDGIVFQNLAGDNISYLTNNGNSDLSYCYTRVESNLKGLEDVNWKITVGNNVYKFATGESIMFNSSVLAGNTLYVNIKTDMTTEQAKQICGQDVLTITYGILDPSYMDNNTLASFVASAESSLLHKHQSVADLNELYDETFVNNLTKQCYWGYSDAVDAGLGFYTIAELMSPEMIAGGIIDEDGKMRAIDQFDASQAGDDKNLLEEEWNAYYDAIAKCNYTNRFISLFGEDYLNRLGQIIGLRAYCYFDLVRLFGNIPYVTEGVLSSDSKQLSPVEICEKINEEAQTAEDYIGSNSNSSLEELSQTAIQLLVANNLMHKDYLENKRGQNAEQIKDYAEKVINSQHGLLKDRKERYNAFARLFALPSTLWEGGQKASSANLNELLKYYVLNDSTVDASMNEILFTQSSDSPNKNRSWQDRLGMLNYGISPYTSGKASLMVNDKFFNSVIATTGTGPSSWPEFELGGVDMTGDERAYEETTLYINGGPEKQTNKLINPEVFVPEGYDSWAAYTSYLPCKFAPVCTTNSTKAEYYPNFIIGRAAEAYLLYAEADALANGGLCTSLGLQMFNTIRYRANTTQSGTCTIEDIYKEFVKELMYEGQGFWIGLRFNGIDKTAASIATTENDKYKNGDTININESNIIEKNGYLQIPYNALIKYGLDQNPGW